MLSQSKPSNKFILVTHNSDQKFSVNHLTQIKPYVLYVYTITPFSLKNGTKLNFINQKFYFWLIKIFKD